MGCVAVLISCLAMTREIQEAPRQEGSRRDGPFVGVHAGWFSVEPTWTWFDSDLGLKDAPGLGLTAFAALDSKVPSWDKWAHVLSESGPPAGGEWEWGLKGDLRYAWSEYELTGRGTFIGTLLLGYSADYLTSAGVSVGGSVQVGAIYLHRNVGGGSRETKAGQAYVITFPRVGIYAGSGLSVDLAPEWELIRSGFNAAHYRSSYALSLALSVTFRF